MALLGCLPNCDDGDTECLVSCVLDHAEIGITTVPREDHAAYIQSWLKVLKGDSKAVFKAAAEAQKALDFLQGLQSTQAEAA